MGHQSFNVRWASGYEREEMRVAVSSARATAASQVLLQAVEWACVRRLRGEVSTCVDMSRVYTNNCGLRTKNACLSRLDRVKHPSPGTGTGLGRVSHQLGGAGDDFDTGFGSYSTTGDPQPDRAYHHLPCMALYVSCFIINPSLLFSSSKAVRPTLRFQ